MDYLISAAIHKMTKITGASMQSNYMHLFCFHIEMLGNMLINTSE
jgi:hypothetical protein